MQQQRLAKLASWGWVVIVSFIAMGAARASEVEKLLMPGKLSEKHAKLEPDCKQCHDRSNRSRQADLCASCHEGIRKDLLEHTGFHGRMPSGGKAQCSACHTEHKGRDADIVKLVPEQIDHSRTDFPLAGMHATVACQSCHTANQPFRKTATTCVACHRKDEPHQGKLGNDCASCHDESTWTKVRFDHGRTRFALRDAHTKVPCAACHFGNRYQKTPTQCISCHAPDDPHRGARGPACQNCHNPRVWKTATFDHAKEAGFPLAGAHGGAECSSCHSSGRMEDPLPKDCAGCHRAQDAHASRFGSNCALCHDPDRWQPVTFEHRLKTKFALDGEHARVACHTCHTAAVATQKLGTDCAACHRGNDVHGGRLGAGCEQCHVNSGWRKEVGFDHALSSFPLLGLHEIVPCEQCHLTRAYHDTKTDCYSCHAGSDRHKGTLGKQCDSCHSPVGWNLWQFDHDKVTGFALNGAHTPLGCADCHKQPATTVKLSRDCASCHSQDDPHFGQFGRQCQRCHSTTSFKQVRTR